MKVGIALYTTDQGLFPDPPKLGVCTLSTRW